MKKTFTQVNKLIVAFLFICCFLPVDSRAQLILTKDMQSYSQDFNSLPVSGTAVWENGVFYLPGWTLNRTSATTTLLTGTGSSNTGGLYSFGMAGSTDRALGAISSATTTVGQFAWGLLIQNNTGSTVTSVTVNFTGEQWRSASRTAGRQATTFWYSQAAATPEFNLSPLSDAGWTNVPDLSFYSLVNFYAAGALNGNLAANRSMLIATIEVNLPQGHYMMLRWKDLNDLDDDHGLAIDDFALTWRKSGESGPTPMPVELISFKSFSKGEHIKLDWATASEINSSHFDVQRSVNGIDFETVGTQNAKGFSSIKVDYSFLDEQPEAGTSYYRLKQTDLDGTYEYSKMVTAKRVGPKSAVLYPTVTTGELFLNLPFSQMSAKLYVYDKLGRVVAASTIPERTVNHKLDISNLSDGNYLIVLLDETGQRQAFKVIKN